MEIGHIDDSAKGSLRLKVEKRKAGVLLAEQKETEKEKEEKIKFFLRKETFDGKYVIFKAKSRTYIMNFNFTDDFNYIINGFYNTLSNLNFTPINELKINYFSDDCFGRYFFNRALPYTFIDKNTFDIITNALKGVKAAIDKYGKHWDYIYRLRNGILTDIEYLEHFPDASVEEYKKHQEKYDKKELIHDVASSIGRYFIYLYGANSVVKGRIFKGNRTTHYIHRNTFEVNGFDLTTFENRNFDIPYMMTNRDHLFEIEKNEYDNIMQQMMIFKRKLTIVYERYINPNLEKIQPSLTDEQD